MRPRHAISDGDWDRIKDLLPGRPRQTGWLAEDNRRFMDAVLWITKTGAPWRDLPERLCKPSRKNTISPRPVDWDRHLVERFWSQAKQYRRVATRFEKKARNVLAFVHLASIMILLR